MKINFSKVELEKVIAHIQNGNNEVEEDCIGGITIGDLMVDLTYRGYDNVFMLDYDVYIIDKNASYGTLDDGRNYDYLDGGVVKNYKEIKDENDLVRLTMASVVEFAKTQERVKAELIKNGVEV